MRQVRLGTGGPIVGAVAYGCWRFAERTAREADALIRTALDLGMTLIDTADIYGYGEPSGFGGAEVRLGEVLAGEKGLRQRMVLASKGGITPPVPYDSSKAYLTRAIEASLKRLKTDVIDLYQIHRPDTTTPFAETAEVLNAAVKAGKIRHVGLSNHTASQARAMAAHLDAPILTMQPEYSALEQTAAIDGVLDWCGETGASVLAWSPLAGGRLATGEVGGDRNAIEVMNVIDRLVASSRRTRTHVALAFAMAHQSRPIPIIGTQTPERIRESARASEVTLTKDEIYQIVTAWRGAPLP